jgi:hypothetical protein
VIVSALLEMDDGVQLRHGGRLLRRRRNDADVALAGVKQQMGPAVAEKVFFEAYFGALCEDGLPLPYRGCGARTPPNPKAIGTVARCEQLPSGRILLDWEHRSNP